MDKKDVVKRARSQQDKIGDAGAGEKPAKKPKMAPIFGMMMQRKKRKTEEEEGAGSVRVDPTTICSWNANGLKPRFTNQREEILNFFAEHSPDVVCIQEARLRALSPQKRNKMSIKGKDFDVQNLVRSFLRAPQMSDYRAYFSLADKMYAGTLTLIKRSCNQSRHQLQFSWRG